MRAGGQYSVIRRLLFGLSDPSVQRFRGAAPLGPLPRERCRLSACSSPSIAPIHCTAIWRHTENRHGDNRFQAERMLIVSFALSAALGAAADILITPTQYTACSIGGPFGINGFIAAIIGGFGSAPAALIGGIFLGVIQSGAIVLFGAGFKNIVALTLAENISRSAAAPSEYDHTTAISLDQTRFSSPSLLGVSHVRISPVKSQTNGMPDSKDAPAPMKSCGRPTIPQEYRRVGRIMPRVLGSARPDIYLPPLRPSA